MTTSPGFIRLFKRGISEPRVSDRQYDEEVEKYAEDSLATAKREGLLLAVRARWVALAVTAVLIAVINPNWEVIYFHFLLLLFAANGYAQLQVGRVGQSRAELLLLLLDLVLLIVVVIVPNPLDQDDWPMEMQYRFGSFIFFFVILASGTMAYSWRTVVAIGTWSAALWMLGTLFVYFNHGSHPHLSEAAKAAFADDPNLAYLLDPQSLNLGFRIQEAVVFLIVAGILAMGVRRSSMLLKSHASLERERTNLARYFSPNVVAELSKNDDPLKQVRTQDVAVLFVDIVGFTAMSDGRRPREIIQMLRDFHGAMEQQVFAHHGTLDKYLGDGLMATFGTPFTSDMDAYNALTCAFAMDKQVERLNAERVKQGHEPLVASYGLHYGPVVLGDIGANRLEFAVIGSTVNVASRLEHMSRTLGCRIVASDALTRKARKQSGSLKGFEEFQKLKPMPVRGIEKPIAVWTR